MHCSHICYESISTQGSYVAYYQQPLYSQYSYYTSCGFWSLGRCTRYGSRLATSCYASINNVTIFYSVYYVQSARTLYNIQYQTISSCCPGYIGSPPSCNREYSYILTISTPMRACTLENNIMQLSIEHGVGTIILGIMGYCRNRIILGEFSKRSPKIIQNFM